MPDRPPISRRSVLGAAGLALVAAGCDTGSTPPSTQMPTRGPVPPDVQTATDALGEIGIQRDQVAATITRFPRLRPTLGPVEAMHSAHYDALVGAVPKGGGGVASARPTPPPVPPRRAAAVRQLALQERRLQNTLAGHAQRAESGTFARMLASMSAAVAQRLAEWPA